MEKCTYPVYELARLSDGLDSSDLVIRQLNRRDDTTLVQEICECGEINLAVVPDGTEGNRKTFRREVANRCEHGLVLDWRGDETEPGRRRSGNSLQREIVALSRTPSENYFRG
jgi:hypothetical protein